MKSLINVLVVGLILIVSACGDIFETDISKETVTVITPVDSLKASVYSTTFWWNKVDGALTYHIQIVKPDFNKVTSLVVDTSLKTTQLVYSLNPGTYQWRIRAENGSSNTAYTTRTIAIDTSGLTNQSILVVSPLITSFNTASVSFNWQTMFGATGYTIQIDSASGNFGTGMLVNQTVSTPPFNFTFPKEGTFIWRVQAINANEKSLFSNSPAIVFDQTAPSLVTLSSPSSGGTYTRPVSLQWNSSSSIDVASYQIYVSKINGTDTSLLTSYPKTITSGTTFSFNEGASGNKFVWRIRAVDKAGNLSGYSVYRSFTNGS